MSGASEVDVICEYCRNEGFGADGPDRNGWLYCPTCSASVHVSELPSGGGDPGRSTAAASGTSLGGVGGRILGLGFVGLLGLLLLVVWLTGGLDEPIEGVHVGRVECGDRVLDGGLLVVPDDGSSSVSLALRDADGALLHYQPLVGPIEGNQVVSARPGNGRTPITAPDLMADELMVRRVEPGDMAGTIQDSGVRASPSGPLDDACNFATFTELADDAAEAWTGTLFADLRALEPDG